MACKNCKYMDLDVKKGYKAYCEWYKSYEDPDHSGCRHFTDRGYSSGCYLTTACVGHKGLSDDCYELQTLRHFRDTYVINQPNGKSIIEDYYSIAPSIVESIKAMPDSSHRWEQLYNNLVMACISFIESGEREKAFELYMKTTNELRQLI